MGKDLNAIAIVAVVAVVVILALAGGMSSEEKSSESPVTVGYSMQVVDSFATIGGYVTEADAGSQYLILTLRITNNSYSSGFNTNPYINEFTVKCNNIEHKVDMDTWMHPDHKDTVTLRIGGAIDTVLVYSVPTGTDPSDVVIYYYGDVKGLSFYPL